MLNHDVNVLNMSNEIDTHYTRIREIVLFHITVNVEIFAQYIFSRISRRALDARKYDVSEKMNH